jgi:hypothetical protein
MGIDLFKNHATGLDSPARGGFVITKSDDTVFAVATRSLFVGGAGNVTVRFVDGDDSVTFTGVPAGFILPVCVDKVYSTGTTATNITGMY